LKGKSYFGYKLLFAITLAVAIGNVVARDFKGPYDYDDPDPQPDTPTRAEPQLQFPLTDRTGDPVVDDQRPQSIDLRDPANVEQEVIYEPETERYYLTEKIGNEYFRNPTYLTLDEYYKYRATRDEQAYWQRRMDALSLFGDKPQLPTMYKDGIFDRIFGGTAISVKPQGNVDVTVGGNWQHIKNPTLVQRAQKYGVFDFDMQMNINLLATVGDKLKLNISNNTRATFDYQNVQKLEYTGKEDEIIKKIELGNVSFPLKSSLISGVQSLFGVKTQLQFGKLWVTGVVSQQRSKRQSMTIQGGGQTQQFAIKADDYEENRHFLLGHFFRENYNNALANYPVIGSLVTINKIEVWVTNRTGAIDGVRNIVAFMDLGEKNPYQQTLMNPNGPIQPDNRSNSLYDQLLQNPMSRVQGQTQGVARSLGLQQTQDFEPVTARKLNPSEYTFNPILGYISVNYSMNPDDVLAVAYRYTYNGKAFQVGEFAEDLPPDSTNQKVMFMKLLKATSARPALPIWDLMMKNVYSLGGMGISREDFRLNIFYQDPGGGEKRYLPEGPNAGVPLLTLLNLDRLNVQNDPAPDGIFDFVDGVTVNVQQGKVIFPVLEPFGRDLAPALGNEPQLERKYMYGILYDSTKTIARQFQQNNRYIIRGSYKSSSSSEIFLGGFNIPPGSVTVTAGGQQLAENIDYQIDYGLGRLRILNAGILNSGIPINVQYEDNATFGFQQQNFMGARMDYFVNDNLTIGSTFMRLTERPFTQKTTFGDDPIKNTVIGLDGNYQSEFPGLTRLLDKLPVYSTTAPSFIGVTAEGATLIPGHPQQINALDPEGAVYIDDFEGTRSAYDLKFPAVSWTLASTPADAIDPNGVELFPEAKDDKDLQYNKNRARLAWYFIEPTLVDPAGGIPDYVKKDPNQHYIRLVQQQDVFPQKTNVTLQNALSTLDLAFYPTERGPYNFDLENIDPRTGRFTNPRNRWGGIQRSIEYSDFEASNVEFIEFWAMDPFINNPTSNGGSLYINLGNVSEDVLKDNVLFFENGIPYPKDASRLMTSQWGYQPLFQQQVTRAFDTDPQARAAQDVGYDGMTNDEERNKYAAFLDRISGVVTNPDVLRRLREDPSSDDYAYFRGEEYDQRGAGILERYKRFNNPQGNSPVTDAGSAFSSAATTIPESEDINRDNTLNTSEDYYQYRIDLKPNLQVGESYVVNKQVSRVKLPNGEYEDETWYQFKVPIRDFTQRVGNISDFRSIRFIRLFMNGFEDSTILRFARLELGRNQWRQYLFSLQNPGENIPEDDQRLTNVTVASVSVEENNSRQPVPYVMPPGVNRQQAAVSSGQNIQMNEQSLSLQVCALKDGDARAVFKEVNVDMRQFGRMRMFIHAESQVGQPILKNGDVQAIIRIGSDFINNYYEYRIPLQITPDGTSDADGVWPERNRLDLLLNDLVQVKTSRNNQGLPSHVPYQETDPLGNTIVVVGNPNIGDAKTILLGVMNPKKTSSTPDDDGLPKCVEVWFNELRMTGLNEKPGYAATGSINLQLADLGNVRLAGSMHTLGYGNIDQKLNQRHRDNFNQYDASTNLNMGKFFPRTWGLQLPVFLGYTQAVSNPQYNPYDLDVEYADQLKAAPNKSMRDSLKEIAQDFTSITSFNVTNMRVLGNPDKPSMKKMPWDIQNFDLTYAYTKQHKRNPLLESDDLTTQKLGLGYAYAIKSKSIEPFKKKIKSTSKWWGLIRDFNFNPLPANFTFRTELNRAMNETQVRNIDEGPYEIPPTYFKNFTWMRSYTTRWELTRSLSVDYNATNQSRIDEPYGRIDTKEKRDTLLDRVGTFGRNTLYTQSANASYNLPLQKIPVTDWTNLRLTYGASYSWTAASQLARGLGNTIGNTQTKQVNGEFNFVQLYNKNRWLRAVNQPKSVNRKGQPVDKKETKTVAEKDLSDPNAQAPPRPPRLNKSLLKRKDIVVINEDTLSTKDFTDTQIDSLRKIQIAQERARLKAEKEKRKQARKAARQQRRNTTPQVSDGMRVAGRLLTMVKRVTFNYTENSGTILPGYLDSTRFMGLNNYNGQPGAAFVYGYQPGRQWLESKAADGKLSRDSLFNAQFQQQYAQNITVNTMVEPFRDLRIDISLTRSFSKSHSELFKDTGTGVFDHLNPYESGSFNISYVALKTMFKPAGANSEVYSQFLEYRQVVSRRLGENNPYTRGTADPNDPSYTKGYTGYSQDVLIPAFIAAYSGRDPNEVALVSYEDRETMRSNPFRYYFPLPNWRISYNGLSKLPTFTPIFNNLVVSHAYTSSLSMNSFVSSLFYDDIYLLGFPSFIDSNSGNYVPFFQVPNITISEQLNPLVGFDAAFKNNVSARFEFRKSRNVSLSMIDYQVSETKSSEFIIGGGYRVRGLNLPFEIFGVRKLKNDLNMRIDLGLRDDKTSNNYLAQNIEITTRGQKVITISPSIDYIASERLTLRLFYDRRQSIPYTTQSFPITTTRAGLTLRFIFAQ
jgi:cell surface protein SprA